MQWLVIAGFGALGALARFAVVRTSLAFFPPPWGTFTVNIGGCFAIGCCAALFSRAAVPDWLAVGLMVGFLGGFTTFSAFSLDTLSHLQARETGKALAYFFLSPALGLVAAWAGLTLTRILGGEG